MSDERHLDASCGCRCYFTDVGDVYKTRVVWCEGHEALAAPLRKMIADFDLILDDIAQKE